MEFFGDEANGGMDGVTVRDLDARKVDNPVILVLIRKHAKHSSEGTVQVLCASIDPRMLEGTVDPHHYVRDGTNQTQPGVGIRHTAGILGLV